MHGWTSAVEASTARRKVAPTSQKLLGKSVIQFYNILYIVDSLDSPFQPAAFAVQGHGNTAASEIPEGLR